MKTISRFIALVVTLALPALGLAATWTIDPEHSNVGFRIRHLMVSNVKGTFDTYTGTVEINDQDISKSKVMVTIDTKSINTRVQKRDDHLRSADFFDVARFPTMTFVSKKVVPDGKEKVTVTGDLTIRGVTREVVLDVEGLTPETKDPWGNFRKGATGTTTINRKDFGLVWNKALETGGVAVGEEVTITLEIEMIRK